MPRISRGRSARFTPSTKKIPDPRTKWHPARGGHGGWGRIDGDRLGDVMFNAKTSEHFRKNIQFPFFEFHLKGKGKGLANATVFETGTNVWRSYDKWPPV